MAPEILPFVVVIGLLVWAVVVAKFKSTPATAVIALMTVALFPRHLVQFGADTGLPPDMAPAFLSISTYTLAIAIGSLLIAADRRQWRPNVFHVVMIMVLVIMIWGVWEQSQAQWSGLILVSTAVAAWGIGSAFASMQIQVSTRKLELGIAVAITILLLGQLVLGMAQLSGVSMPVWLTSEGRLDVAVTSRAIGTLGHPANLSKVAFLLMLVLLPLTASTYRTVRRWAVGGIVVAVLLASITISRANILAVVLTLVLWLIWSPRGLTLGQRLFLLTGLASVSLLALPTVIDRFVDDPDGGARPELLGAGLNQISTNLWGGTGLNSYILKVSEFDPATRLGYPVHNTFLFVLAEFGLVCAILFFIPLLVMAIRAFRRVVGLASFATPWARTFICAAPGFLIITLTGWGMASGSSLILWFLINGYFYRILRPVPTSRVKGQSKSSLASSELGFRSTFSSNL